jgi:hypothetical protein
MGYVTGNLTIIVPECMDGDCADYDSPTRHRLGWILVEHIELTDKYSRLRGPPGDAGFFRIPVLILG